MWEEFSELGYNDDGAEYRAYGIRRGNFRIGDITVNHAEISELVDRFNRYDASQIHAQELVEDYLAEIL